MMVVFRAGGLVRCRAAVFDKHEEYTKTLEKAQEILGCTFLKVTVHDFWIIVWSPYKLTEQFVSALVFKYIRN